MRNPSQLLPGDVFAGEFRIMRQLGSGGMGVVFEVQQMSTGMSRALKLMQPHLVESATARRQFSLEARVASQVRSNHVVQVLGAGVEPNTQIPWLVMELLDGENLKQFVGRRRKIDLATLLALYQQLCHGVAAAHEARIVHRDLKPENVFIARSNTLGMGSVVKVLDFGIAKFAIDHTHSTQMVGSFAWLAPEQADSKAKVTPAADVWSLGLLAFYLLTGQSFWRAANEEGGNVFTVMKAMLFDDIPLASARAKECGTVLPPPFDRWFSRCLQRDPAARFADARAALDALTAASDVEPNSQGLNFPPKPVASESDLVCAEANAQSGVNSSAIPVARTNPRTANVRRPRVVLRWAAAALALALASTCFYFWFNAHGSLNVKVTADIGPPIEAIDVEIGERLVHCNALPCEIQDVDVGSRALTVRADGFVPQTRTVAISPRTRADVTLTLKTQRIGGIFVHAGPRQENLTLWIDDKKLGPLPQRVMGLTEGNHKLRIEGPRYADLEELVSIRPGILLDYARQLKVSTGLLSIRPGVGADGLRATLVNTKHLMRSAKDQRRSLSIPSQVEVSGSEQWVIIAEKDGLADYFPVGFDDGLAEKTVTLDAPTQRQGKAATAPLRGKSQGRVVVPPPQISTPEPESTEAGAPSLDPEAVKNAVGQKVKEVQRACRLFGGYRGSVTAEVTFKDTGRVSHVTVYPMRAGAVLEYVGDCAVQHLATASVPPFSGPASIYTQAFVIPE